MGQFSLIVTLCKLKLTHSCSIFWPVTFYLVFTWRWHFHHSLSLLCCFISVGFLRCSFLGSSFPKVKKMAKPYNTINVLSFMLEWCTEAFWKMSNPSQNNIGDWRLGHTKSLPWAVLIQSLKQGECFNTINTAVIAYCLVWERMTSKYGGFNFGIIYSKTFKY